MKKTTVYLTEDLKSALGRIAVQSGRSEAELIREAVRELVRDSEPPRPRLPLFSSGDPTLAERVDEELAEFDYLLATRVGGEAELALLEEVARETYRLARFSFLDMSEARRVMEQYADLRISLTDASNVVLAHRNDTLDVLTLDERHFRVLRGPGGRPFRLLPADAG